MSDITQVRSALAASMRAIPRVNVQAYPSEAPQAPTLSVFGFETIDYDVSYGPDSFAQVIIEGVAGRWLQKGSFETFDQWVQAEGELSVPAALEADQTLTKRMAANGAVTTGQDPVASSVHVAEFRGYNRFDYPGGASVLLGTWLVEVLLI